MNLKHIFDLWPSVSAMAADAGVTTDAAYKWLYRGRIPADRWPSLISSAQRRGFSLTPADLLNARRAA